MTKKPLADKHRRYPTNKDKLFPSMVDKLFLTSIINMMTEFIKMYGIETVDTWSKHYERHKKNCKICNGTQAGFCDEIFNMSNKRENI
jgi:hypothetical protein